MKYEHRKEIKNTAQRKGFVTFGFDEELAGFGAGHMELLDGEGPVGLPEDGSPHERRTAGDVIAGGVDPLLLGGSARERSPWRGAGLGVPPEERARDRTKESHGRR